MRALLSSTVVFMLMACSAVANVSPEVRCPVEVGILRDGGTIFIKVPAYGGRPSLEIFVDHGIDTKTPGQYYLGDAFVTKAAPMKIQEVLSALHQIETILVEKYGKDELFRIVMNPLIVGKNLTVEEYVKMQASDPHFIEKVDVLELLDRIKEYRSQHTTEKTRLRTGHKLFNSLQYPHNRARWSAQISGAGPK